MIGDAMAALPISKNASSPIWNDKQGDLPLICIDPARRGGSSTTCKRTREIPRVYPDPADAAHATPATRLAQLRGEAGDAPVLTS
ncbi:hypothetical protein [Jiangella alkaliphila]|uniref:hypothetical protein n=1 Tax=Jiangella alkaliphila TaxID=419479 RepID=UPI00128E2D52|nr:hypothetical protein [Jiangella alkaliphila]